MISKYLEILDSVKEYHFPEKIESISNKIISAVKSKHFNSKIAAYFTQMNHNDEPFTHFEEEPDNVTQIKKVINALYHARLACMDLENIEPKKLEHGIENTWLLYNYTIESAYEACRLITHLDIDLRGLFSEELAVLYPLISKLQEFGNSYSEQTKEITNKIKSFPLSYNSGWVSGMAIDKMQASNGDIDYSFLTQFSSVLPSYIEQFSDYVKKYSSEFIENEPKLNQEKLEELRKTALSLLNHLDDLKGNDLIVSVKYLNYIHIIRHVITLSMSSLEQMHNLSDSSQDVIRDNIAQLKYKVLPSLFGLVDKIEVNAMLNPGTLSVPLMEKIKPLYDLLLHYASKPVDFHKKGEELLSIEDSRFLALRLELTYKRIDEANKALIKNQRALQALNDFYKILEDNPAFGKQSVHELPKEIKEQLISHYKVIRPFMTKVDVDLNDALIDSLNGGETWSSYISRPWRWVWGQLPPDHVSLVLEKKEAIRALISKEHNTHLLHKELNNDIIASVHQKADLALFPHSEQSNVFAIDESLACNPLHSNTKNLKFSQDNAGNTILSNPDELTSDQALDLYQWYKNKHNKFINAKDAYIEFIDLLNQYNSAGGSENTLRFSSLDQEQKTKLISLYNRFQPYFIGIMPKDYKTAVIHFDKLLVHGLQSKNNIESTLAIDNVPLDFFLTLNNDLQNHFTQFSLEWIKKSNFFLKISAQKNLDEIKKGHLEHDTSIGKRAHHLIPHTNYSNMINEFRKALYQMTNGLNSAMRKELSASNSGLPFPELEDYNSTLAQSKQVLALKRIFNSLYHLEEIFHELEKLDDRSSKPVYIYHVGLVYYHFDQINKSTKQLLTDPYFKLIGRELFDKAQSLFATLQEHSIAYQAGPDSIPDGETVQHNALWYTINAFYISPKHIRVFSDKDYLTTQELAELQLKAKKATINIETIINSSSSYFKLFLQTPAMYSLYTELKSKLYEFTGTTHDAVIDNLDQIRSQIITPMLLEADHWEMKLGLKPGTISNTMKNITDEYLKGLIYPMHLHSKQHIEIICDESPLEKRMQAIYQKIEKTSKQIDALEIEYAGIETLYKAFQSYENLTTGLIPAPEIAVACSKKHLIDTYKKTLPQLNAMKKAINHEPCLSPEESKIDELLNSSTKEYDVKLYGIKALTISSHQYYLGLRASYHLKFETAKEKLEELTQLADEQAKTNSLFVEEYTQEAFNQHMEAYCNRHIGLQFTDKEYRSKLKEHLLTFKDGIILSAKQADDINLTIKNALQEKIKSFEKNNFAKYYQLDTINAALAQFKAYLSQCTKELETDSSTSENQETIKTKNRLINIQVDIAENEQLSVEERINKIKDNVTTNYFRNKILAQRHIPSINWTYIKQCFLSLLEALHLYTPKRKKLMNHINEAVSKEPQMSELSKRFGLFNTHENTESDEPSLLVPTATLST